MARTEFIYVTYIRTTREKLWEALTSSEFTKQYFAGFAIDVEPREGGAFRMLYPDGRVHIAGRVIEWSPPRRFACTWVVEGMAEFRDLPECLVTYEIEPAGESVQLTMTEAHSWDVPDDLLSGGRAGWPAILSSLKSVLRLTSAEFTANSGFSVVAPISEEIMFRGFATTAWMRGMGRWRGVVRGALFFAVVHVLTISGIDASQAVGVALAAFVGRIPVAFALGWLFQRTGTIWASLGLHATFNAILLIIAEVAARGGIPQP